jgi:Putative DNA-binding domain
MSLNLGQLIASGESATVDFKQSITSPKKIAKTLVAFANTHGGHVLVGVKDNGKVNGIEPEEEKYMLEGAAHLHCKPRIELIFQETKEMGKNVLIATVLEGENKPYYAEDEDGKWWVYVRSKDQVLKASRILLNVLKRNTAKENTTIRYTEIEKQLFAYLAHHQEIGFYDFCNLVNIKPYKASEILTDLVCSRVLTIIPGEKFDVFMWNAEE